MPAVMLELVIYDKHNNDVTNDVITQIKLKDAFWLHDVMCTPKQVYIGEATIQIYLNEDVALTIEPEITNENDPVNLNRSQEVQELLREE
jgi:hypothetical protein